MGAIRSKLSVDQLKRATRSRTDLAGGRVAVTHLEDNEESEIASFDWEETSSDDWREATKAMLEDHAESMGPGLHRYAVRTFDAKDVQRAQTWCRVHIARDRKEPADASDASELDGSADALMRHYARAFEEERKSRLDVMRMVTGMQGDMMKVLAGMAERQHMVEAEYRAQREAEKADLKAALEELAKTQESGSSDGPLGGLGDLLAGPVLDKLLDRFEPQLKPLVEHFAKDILAGAEAEAGATVDVVPVPRLDS